MEMSKLTKTLLKVGLCLLIGLIILSIFGNYEISMFALYTLIGLSGLAAIVFIICGIVMCRDTPEEKERKRKEEERRRQERIQYQANEMVRDMLAGKPNPEFVKMQQKKETKEIIKGAVAGGIVAGNAGAVVGAMIAKNKIDNKKKQ